jgi:hypothetical protein
MLKIGGGVLLLCVSIGLFIKRMPSTKYAEVHADKPRVRPVPAAQAETAAQARAPRATPAPSQPAPKTAAPQPLTPGPGVLTAASLPAAGSAEAEPEKVDLVESCKAEIGVLCYEVPEERLPGCLGRYADVLMKGCKTAMESLGFKLDQP